MSKNKPRLSIGLPVFNGEKHLKEAFDSILSQTYKDFELIISDNASTDKTPQICLEYAKKDSRIHYYRNKINIGAARNFNRVFELSSGKYFKWAAHDDILAPDFLSKCVNVLDQDPSVVLCHTKVGCIDENGVFSGIDEHEPINYLRKTHERFAAVLNRNLCWMIFGVIRADTLKMTNLMGDYIRADWNLLAEISLYGRLYEIPEVLFFRRHHRQAYTNKYYLSGPIILPDYQKQLEWWASSRKKSVRALLPHWKICLEYFKSVKRSPLKWKERLLCYEKIGRWVIREGWQFMKWDIGCYLATTSRLMYKYYLARQRAHAGG